MYIPEVGSDFFGETPIRCFALLSMLSAGIVIVFNFRSADTQVCVEILLDENFNIMARTPSGP